MTSSRAVASFALTSSAHDRIARLSEGLRLLKLLARRILHLQRLGGGGSSSSLSHLSLNLGRLLVHAHVSVVLCPLGRVVGLAGRGIDGSSASGSRGCSSLGSRLCSCSVLLHSLASGCVASGGRLLLHGECLRLLRLLEVRLRLLHAAVPAVRLIRGEALVAVVGNGSRSHLEGSASSVEATSSSRGSSTSESTAHALEGRHWRSRSDVAHLQANYVLRVVNLVGGSLDHKHLLGRVGRRVARQLTVSCTLRADLLDRFSSLANHQSSLVGGYVHVEGVLDLGSRLGAAPLDELGNELSRLVNLLAGSLDDSTSIALRRI
ncbi:hypothetical protein PFISCL1PPCAC_26175 [Pristionchus fissidentatus]|uniref:Uncharacterized protein n=1 Tax=Pristionchus fissidentatus TaxID=1538716 RepID=A0AAV5WU84_9BILA|nr:hypothetical protein PFISCL1PPCAC_26175 [Pristionchus fissidentatus]